MPSCSGEKPPLGTQSQYNPDWPWTLPGNLKPLQLKSCCLTHRSADPMLSTSKSAWLPQQKLQLTFPSVLCLDTVVMPLQHVGLMSPPPQQVAPETLCELPLGVHLSKQGCTSPSAEITTLPSLAAGFWTPWPCHYSSGPCMLIIPADGYWAPL